MSLFLFISVIAFSLIISFQDLKERKVSIWALAAFSLVIAAEAFYSLPFKQEMTNVLLNVGFLAVQFCLVFLYYYLRYKGVKKLLSSFGGADLWVILSLTLAFSLPNFMIFMVFSLLASLLTYFVCRLLVSVVEKHIPLAGFICIIYCISRIIMYFYSPHFQWNDEWVQSLNGNNGID